MSLNNSSREPLFGKAISIVFIILPFTLLLTLILIDYINFKLPLIVLAFIGVGLFILVILERGWEIEYIFLFLIVLFSLVAFSSFPLNAFFNINNFKILLFLTILAIFFNLFSQNIKVDFFPKSYREGILLYSFLILFFISVVIVNTDDFFSIDGFSKSILYITSGIYFARVIPLKLLQSEIMIDIFLKILINFGILAGLVGIVTIFTNINPQFVFPGQSVSFFKHPNATSSIYNFTIPPALYFLLFKNERINKIERKYYIVGIVIMAISLLFTFSRSGIISIALVGILMTFHYSKKSFISILISVPFTMLYLIKDFLTSKGAGTFLSRAGLLTTAYVMMKSSKQGFYWGFGAISTEHIFEKTKLALSVIDANNVPHNIFIYFILQFGLIAAIPLYIFFFWAMGRCLILVFRKECNKLLLLSFSICLSLIFKNVGEDLVIFPEFFLYYLFLIFFGFSVFLSKQNFAETETAIDEMRQHLQNNI